MPSDSPTLKCTLTIAIFKYLIDSGHMPQIMCTEVKLKVEKFQMFDSIIIAKLTFRMQNALLLKCADSVWKIMFSGFKCNY
jgi:hypothetical protein